MNIYQRVKVRIPPGWKKALRPLYFSPAADYFRRILHLLLGKKSFSASLVAGREEFLWVHPFCGREHFPGYINFDQKKTGATDYVSRPDKIFLPTRSAGRIEVSSLPRFISRGKLSSIFREWHRILIPGGVVIIEGPEGMTGSDRKGYFFPEIRNLLQENSFAGIRRAAPRNFRRLSRPWLRIEAYQRIEVPAGRTLDEEWRERKEKRPRSLTLEWRKNHLVRGSIFTLPFRPGGFDSGYAIEVIEHLEPAQLRRMFLEARRVLKPGAPFLLTTPNKDAYFDPGQRRFFTRGSLARLLDEENLAFDWIDLEERKDRYRGHSLLKVLARNRPAFTLSRPRKILAIGAYDVTGYNHLGYHWDGQARAFRSLGFETLLLDIRKDPHYENLKARMEEFKPDILWLGLKDCLPFMEWMKSEVIDFRRRGGKVIYWYCDLREPRPRDLGGLIDVIFITSAGQIDAYRRAYGVREVYYMPQACTPAFMHRLPLEEIYDLGLTSSLVPAFHGRRVELLEKLREKYQVAVRHEVRNTVSNFYSKCRLVLGFNAHKTELYYTSNRFYVALGCGAVYLCEWFPGIERLAENGRHLVWFKGEEELFDLAGYYLSHPGEREEIRRQAQELAHARHTYVHRIRNMLDIIDGKTDRFYGLLREQEDKVED